MIKVSVLVAVYNAEKYLNECLDSLIAQTLQDIQIICVDDCSTDDSLSIINKYKEKDNRIEVISLSQNMGQAHARNVALARAKGEYITFLDSDDWMSPDALQSALAIFEQDENIDCVLFRGVFHYPNGQDIPYPMHPFTELSGYEAFVKSLTWEIHGLYIIKSSIHKLYVYDETCKYYSDDNTTRIHYLKSRKVSCCEGTYFYRQVETSVTHHIDGHRFDYMLANESMKRQLMALHVSDEIIDIYENVRWLVVIDSYMFYYMHREELSNEDKKYGLSEMKRVWNGIETKRLKRSNRLKFGYIPMKFSWKLFRIQEEIYFYLRRIKSHFAFLFKARNKTI